MIHRVFEKDMIGWKEDTLSLSLSMMYMSFSPSLVPIRMSSSDMPSQSLIKSDIPSHVASDIPSYIGSDTPSFFVSEIPSQFGSTIPSSVPNDNTSITSPMFPSLVPYQQKDDDSTKLPTSIEINVDPMSPTTSPSKGLLSSVEKPTNIPTHRIYTNNVLPSNNDTLPLEDGRWK